MPTESEPSLQERVQSAITRLLHAIDALDWRGVREAFTPKVRIDYTSLFGGVAETLPVDGLLERWQALLPGFDATQHQIGPVLVVHRDGGAAIAETEARGYHYVEGAEGGVLWTAAGMYTFTMDDRLGEWKIAGITFRLAYQEGNLGLPALAQARVAAGRRRKS